MGESRGGGGLILGRGSVGFCGLIELQSLKGMSFSIT